MASISSLSKADIQRLFSEDAVFSVEDQAVGEQVRKIQQQGFPIESADGLEFCKRNILDDTRIRHVLEALFPWSGLGLYEVYRVDANHVYAFMTGLNSNMNAVVVQLWSPQSSMQVYGGSQRLRIQGFIASNGLLEIPSAPLKTCKEVDIKLEKGGLAILDARLAFKAIQGFAIYFVFATKDELQGWPKKKFPDEEGLKEIASQMETPTIGLNFVFQDS